MRKAAHRIKTIHTEAGAGGVLSRGAAAVYRRWLRPILPATPVRYNDVLVGYRSVADAYLPEGFRYDALWPDPTYESSLVKALQHHVTPGDAVVVVGSGAGVTAVVAARRVGDSGRVICFEGATERVEWSGKTARLNAMQDRIEVVHAIVARAITLWGSAGAATIIAPGELPSCDVLQLDCEGAELEIITGMTIRPRVVIVETHGVFGASTATVQAELEARRYAVESLGVADVGYAEHCLANDIFVLVGTQPPGASN